MRSLLRDAPILLVGALLLGSCGGGTTTSTPPTTTKTIAPAVGDNQTALASAAVAIRPAVRVTDQNNAGVSGITVTFAVASGGGSVTGATATTGSDGLAAVGNWTLGSTPGVNTLTASASGVTGSPVTFTATGTLAVFSPTSDTTLSGMQTFASVTIPAGVTVRMTADLSLNVSGGVTIAGTLTGDCVNLTITAAGVLSSNGNINNGCGAPTATPPSMTIIATGGYHLTGGTVTLGGALNLSNDASLTDGTFPAGPSTTTGASASQAGVCAVAPGTAFIANPLIAKAGTPGGPVGGPGIDGGTWILQCTGELDFSGFSLVHGQHGGAGGAGVDTRTSGATATGGNGGKGGTIKIRAVGDVVISGTGNDIQSGNGGAGGNATATATQAGNPAGNATAIGGNGAVPGNIIVEAKNGSIHNDGAVTLRVGSGGVGGDATATAADGQNGPSCPAGQGGAASATGGIGGLTPDKQLITTGTVTGLAGFSVAGGAAGNGGWAQANGGRGGTGGVGCPGGGNGGLMTAIGGPGGNAMLRDANGALFGLGGDGGEIAFTGGGGGDGFNGCTRPNVGVGGRGGSGGGASGSAGAFGTGKVNGSAGGGLLIFALNGGQGGDGLPPGHLGLAGINNASSSTPFAIDGLSLSPGGNGGACPFSFTATFTPANDAGNFDGQFWHLAGTRTVTMQASGPVSGQLGADGTFAQMTGAIASLVLNGEFFVPPPSQWNSRTLNQPIGARFATVTFGGVFTFPATPSGLHFVGTLVLSSTFPTSAPITYNVVMDAQ